MEILSIQPSASTPKITFNSEKNVFEISGESYPENAFEFYGPILSWLKDYLQSKRVMEFKVHISYMNSSSIKCVLDMLDLLEEAKEKGGQVVVNWVYDPENPRALDLAEEFREEVTLPFNIIPTEDDFR